MSSTATAATGGNGGGKIVTKNGSTAKHDNSLSTEERWIVAMTEEGNPLVSAFKVDSTGRNGPGTGSSTVVVDRGDVIVRTFPDPSTGENRQYFVTEDYQIMEVQSLEADFSSYFVERHVVQDGNLYMVNRVDPLFFFLSAQSITVENKEKEGKRPWRPVDQTVANDNVPHEVQRALLTDFGRCQLRHLCVTFQNDDLFFLKFDTKKALQWLQKKQEGLLKCMIHQHNEQSRKGKLHRNVDGSSSQATKAKGSISDTFIIPDQKELESSKDATSGSPSSFDPTCLSEAQKQGLKVECLQIVCNYLNDEWSRAFVDHLGLTVPLSTEPPNGKNGNQTAVSPDRPSTQDGSGDTSLSSSSLSTKKTAQTAQSAGNKQLAKVKTKGMKSIASFFGGTAKKPAKKAKIQ